MSAHGLLAGLFLTILLVGYAVFSDVPNEPTRGEAMAARGAVVLILIGACGFCAVVVR